VLAVLATARRARRADTTRLGEMRVVRGPKSQHGVLARHDTIGLLRLTVSCLTVFVSCRGGRPIWTSIPGKHQQIGPAARLYINPDWRVGEIASRETRTGIGSDAWLRTPDLLAGTQAKQSVFEDAPHDRVCVRVFIGMSVRVL
jgi:hypothetical protein